MSMKLTRREALKGVAAFGAISFMPAGAFAAADRPWKCRDNLL